YERLASTDRPTQPTGPSRPRDGEGFEVQLMPPILPQAGQPPPAVHGCRRQGIGDPSPGGTAGRGCPCVPTAEGGCPTRSQDRQRAIAPERSSLPAQGTNPKSRPVRRRSSSSAARRTTGSASSRRPTTAGPTWEFGRLPPNP